MVESCVSFIELPSICIMINMTFCHSDWSKIKRQWVFLWVVCLPVIEKCACFSMLCTLRVRSWRVAFKHTHALRIKSRVMHLQSASSPACVVMTLMTAHCFKVDNWMESQGYLLLCSSAQRNRFINVFPLHISYWSIQLIYYPKML